MLTLSTYTPPHLYRPIGRSGEIILAGKIFYKGIFLRKCAQCFFKTENKQRRMHFSCTSRCRITFGHCCFATLLHYCFEPRNIPNACLFQTDHYRWTNIVQPVDRKCLQVYVGCHFRRILARYTYFIVKRNKPCGISNPEYESIELRTTTTRIIPLVI